MDQALTAAKLPLAEFCELTGYPIEQVRRWLAGEIPGGAELERCALVFGVSVADLVGGAAPSANMTLLFKRNREPDTSAARKQLFDLETNLGPNRFCRAVNDLARLNKLLGRPAPSLPSLPLKAPPLGNPGDHMAKAAREALGIEPKARIDSMRQLLASFGVDVLVAGTDEVDRRINGASTSTPLPVVMVSRGTNEAWVLRVTLAHELAHLLFHGGAFTVSPGARTSTQTWVLDLEFADHEQQADAFAAAFLAPRFAVEDLLNKRALAPESMAAISAVGSHFGVGKEAAVNRIVDSFSLSAAARDRMLSLPAFWKREFASDTFSESEVGLQGGVLRERVLEALQRKLIDTMTARAILSVPDGVTIGGEAEAPSAQTRRAAHRIQVLASSLGWPGFPVDLEPSAAGWTARLVDMEGTTLGKVRLDSDEQRLHRLDS